MVGTIIMWVIDAINESSKGQGQRITSASWFDDGWRKERDGGGIHLAGISTGSDQRAGHRVV